MSQTATSFDFDPRKTLTKQGGLWRLLKGFRIRYASAMLTLAIATLTKTSVYLLLRHFIDNVLAAERAEAQFPLIAAGFIVLAILQGLFTFLSGRLAAQTAEGIIQRLRNFLFNHIQTLSFSFHDRTKTGELIQRSTSDVETLRRFFADQAIGLGRILMLFLINFTAILILNWSLALISVAVVPVLLLVSSYFYKRISRTYEAYQDQEAKLTTTLQENLSGVRVVKAFARQQFERDKFEGDNLEKFHRGKRLIMIHSAFWPITDMFCGVQMLAGFLVGALMVIRGSFTLGGYLAYAGMIIWIIFPMRNMGRMIVEISKAKVSQGRIADIIREDPERMGRERRKKELKGEVVFQQVSFNYSDEIPVLEEVSLSCRSGEVVALLGPTGSGKTTLVNLLPRFYEYSSGSIRLDECELNTYSKSFLRKVIGVVEQEPFLFSLSIRDNIAYGLDRSVEQGEIEAAAKAAAIHDSILEFPKQYDTLVGEKGVTLSGGQKQRVAIARAILKDPRILILDDSTSSVDTETAQSIWQALKRLMQNRTTFIIAHRIQSLMTADLICVMDKGRIVQQGSHEELLRQAGIYRRIYEMQSRIDVEVEREIASV